MATACTKLQSLRKMGVRGLVGWGKVGDDQAENNIKDPTVPRVPQDKGWGGTKKRSAPRGLQSNYCISARQTYEQEMDLEKKN